MPIPYIDQIPKRNTQGTKLSSLQHDDIHEQLRSTINALIDEINGLTVGGGGGSVPTGTVLEYASSLLPTGYLWANGQAVSRTFYADLFNAIGTTYGAGDTVTTFNVPNHIGRVASGVNPMGGVTEIALSLRNLGDTFGDESILYTPSGSVSQASIGSLTATCGVIDTSGLLINSVDLDSLLNGVTATCAALDPSQFVVNIDSASISGTGTPINVTNSTPCVNVNDALETPVSVIPCGASFTVSAIDIAAQLSPSITASLSTPSPYSPAITVNHVPAVNISVAGAIPTPIITIGGSIPSQIFTGTPSYINVLQPSIAMNFIIKY